MKIVIISKINALKVKYCFFNICEKFNTYIFLETEEVILGEQYCTCIIK